jgi:hypothetical protein
MRENFRRESVSPGSNRGESEDVTGKQEGHRVVSQVRERERELQEERRKTRKKGSKIGSRRGDRGRESDRVAGRVSANEVREQKEESEWMSIKCLI